MKINIHISWFWVIVQIVLIALKITNVITSWYVALIPTIISVVMFFIFVCVCGILSVILAIKSRY